MIGSAAPLSALTRGERRDYDNARDGVQLRLRRSRPLAPRAAAHSHSMLVKWMAITDANSAGSIHGGTVLKLCDEAAGLAAIKHSRCRVVTAGMDRTTFLHPIAIAELLTLRASVNAVWQTRRGRR